jgi:hypothetical protein
MFKVALVVWVMLATAVAGMAVTAVVATPSLADKAAILIPAAFLGGIILAIPLSYLVAKKIAATARA